MICSNCGGQVRPNKVCAACGYASPFKIKVEPVTGTLIGPDDDVRSMIEAFVENLIASQERGPVH